MFVGQTYKVPCAVLEDRWILKSTNLPFIFETDELDPDDELLYKPLILPIYLNLHDDIESGQDYKHYHVDTRWNYNYGFERNRIIESDVKEIVYLDLELLKTEERFKTTPDLIYKHIHNHSCKNMKCVHKGFDLSNQLVINGKVTCPLHGLVYDYSPSILTVNFKETLNLK